MGRASKIWRYKLEKDIKSLYLEHRKTPSEIAEIFLKKKNISISREAIRNFLINGNYARKNKRKHGKTKVKIAFLPN